MAKEVETPELQVATPPAAQAEQAPVNNDEVSRIESVLADFGDSLSETEKAELIKHRDSILPPAAPATPDAKTEGDAAEEEPATPAAKTGKENEPPAAPEKKSILGLGKKKPVADVVIEKPEQVFEVIKSKFGQDYKDFKELPKFFESAQGWRKDSEKLKTVESEHERLKDEVMNLPEEFHEAFKLYAQGQDYSGAFAKKPKLNYALPFEKQDKKELVEKYFPGKFTKEDFDATDDKSEAMKIAEEASKMKFEADKQIYDHQRADVSEKANRKLDSYKSAANSSVEGLKKRFPEMDQTAFSEVKSMIDGGAQKILSVFFDKNGNPKPEAATRLMMAQYGEEEINTMIGAAVHVAETQINEDLVSKGADKPKPKQSGNKAVEEIDPVTKKQIDEIEKIGNAKVRRTF